MQQRPSPKHAYRAPGRTESEEASGVLRGKRMIYRNLDERAHLRSPKHLLRWKLGLGPEPRRVAPGRCPVPAVHNDGRALAEALTPSLTWIGHATYLLQLAGRSVLTDPILSPRLGLLSRNVAPGLSWEALPRIDVVTVSHNHFDHMDRPTLVRLARRSPRPAAVVPLGLARPMRAWGFDEVAELDWWGTARVRGLDVTLVPAQHWSRRSAFDQDKTLWGGFVIEGGGLRAYHSGDTAYFSGFAQIGARVGSIDAAMLPIGAYDPRWFMREQHMNPEDAVQAFVELGAARFFAMHWGTFKLTDEPLDEPPRLTRELFARRGLDAARLVIPAVGETVALGLCSELAALGLAQPLADLALDDVHRLLLEDLEDERHVELELHLAGPEPHPALEAHPLHLERHVGLGRALPGRGWIVLGELGPVGLERALGGRLRELGGQIVRDGVLHRPRTLAKLRA